MNKNNVMVDIESLSTRSNAIILTIGAMKFDRNDNWSHKTPSNFNKIDTFYKRIEIKSCEDVGLHRDPKTEQWWKQQDKEAQREALTHPNRVTLTEALDSFTNWLEDASCMWSHGACFDIPILGEAYLHCGKEIPWKYYLIRDTRTLYEIGGVFNNELPKNNKHHALYDCYRQIFGVQKALRNLEK